MTGIPHLREPQTLLYNESGLQFRRNKICWIEKCTSPNNRPSNFRKCLQMKKKLISQRTEILLFSEHRLDVKTPYIMRLSFLITFDMPDRTDMSRIER